MTEVGSKIIEGAKDAAAIARGEIPAAKLTIDGHVYVPLASSPAIDKAIEALEPFAAEADKVPRPPDETLLRHLIADRDFEFTVGDLRRAAEALSALRGQEDGS